MKKGRNTYLKPIITMYRAIIKDGYFPGDKIKKEMVKYITMPSTYKLEKAKTIN